MAEPNSLKHTAKVLINSIKAFYDRFLKIRGTPEQIALGMALGLFIGMSPFWGFQTVSAVALASLLGWSKISAAIGVMVTNPVTAPVIYTFTYQLGSKITGFSNPGQISSLFKTDGFLGLIKTSPMIIADLIVGGIIISIPLCLAGYYITLSIITTARKKIRIRPVLKPPKDSKKK